MCVWNSQVCCFLSFTCVLPLVSGFLTFSLPVVLLLPHPFSKLRPEWNSPPNGICQRLFQGASAPTPVGRCTLNTAGRILPTPRRGKLSRTLAFNLKIQWIFKFIFVQVCFNKNYCFKLFILKGKLILWEKHHFVPEACVSWLEKLCRGGQLLSISYLALHQLASLHLKFHKVTQSESLHGGMAGIYFPLCDVYYHGSDLQLKSLHLILKRCSTDVSREFAILGLIPCSVIY